jgi:hypothetical protein
VSDYHAIGNTSRESSKPGFYSQKFKSAIRRRLREPHRASIEKNRMRRRSRDPMICQHTPSIRREPGDHFRVSAEPRPSHHPFLKLGSSAPHFDSPEPWVRCDKGCKLTSATKCLMTSRRDALATFKNLSTPRPIARYIQIGVSATSTDRRPETVCTTQRIDPIQLQTLVCRTHYTSQVYPPGWLAYRVVLDRLLHCSESTGSDSANLPTSPNSL